MTRVETDEEATSERGGEATTEEVTSEREGEATIEEGKDSEGEATTETEIDETATTGVKAMIDTSQAPQHPAEDKVEMLFRWTPTVEIETEIAVEMVVATRMQTTQKAVAARKESCSVAPLLRLSRPLPCKTIGLGVFAACCTPEHELCAA